MIKNSYSIKVICDSCKEQINKNDAVIMSEREFKIGYLKDLSDLSADHTYGLSNSEMIETTETVHITHLHLNCFSKFLIKLNKTMELKVFS